MDTNNTRHTVLLLISRAVSGGAQRHVLQLVDNVSEFCYVVAVGERGPLVDELRERGIEVHILPLLKYAVLTTTLFRSVKILLSLLRAHNVALIHSHSTVAGLFGRLLGRFTRTPNVFTAHGWSFAANIPFLRRTVARLLERRLCSCADRIIVVSQADCVLAEQYGICSTDKLVLVRNGSEQLGPVVAQSENRIVTLTMIARFEQQKDFDTLLSAFEQLEGKCLLQFVGDGPLFRKVKALVAGKDWANAVRFAGWRSDIPRVLADSDIFVLTSHWEGLPISIIEAMSVGLPVIATDVGGVSEAVDHMKTGVLVRHRDIEGVAAALRLLVESRSLRTQMGLAGYARWKELFTIDRMVAETESVYKEMLSNF